MAKASKVQIGSHNLQTNQFNAVDVKKTKPGTAQGRQMRDNIIESYLAASPEQRKAGDRWYEQAHRAAVHVATGIDPNSTTAKAHHRARYTPPAAQEDIDTAAGAIARLSPSNPAGMRWQDPQSGRLENAGAAHAVKKMTPAQVDTFRNTRRVPRGAEDVRKAAGYAVERAHEMFQGHRTPEDDMVTGTTPKGKPKDIRKKIGSFYQNIRDPKGSNAATVDTRSHDIAVGVHGLGWQDPRGLSAVGRYRNIEQAHQEATEVLKHMTDNPDLKPHQVQATSWLANYDQVRGSRHDPYG